eukprot:TRINITY_DN13895_c0_g5_i1.p1 TRINITY_DN13895_c0_g5~~TRINITY_DN13895_c0_g5_i1.p1  ORF type:complete len:547 (-),score=202.97 TRINITY_DN13895_c0_g5_i1:202-1842(-)
MAEEAEKRLKALNKKLKQIFVLKEKDPADLDADQKEKVDSEAALREEVAALEAQLRGEGGAAAAPPAAAPKSGGSTANSKDPHAVDRAAALEAPPGDIGLLLDDETEKRFKALQKKLRDIGKLHEKDKLDKLQAEKLLVEPSLIEEINGIRKQAVAKLESRRKEQEARQAKPKKKSAGGGYPDASDTPATAEPKREKPAWQCLDCGASGSIEQLMSGDGTTCPKCGSPDIHHIKPDVEEEEDDGEEEAAEAEKKEKKKSNALATARQRAQPAAKKKDDGVALTPASAKWPEVKDVLESGNCGVDKGKQKKAIQVEQSKAVAPYDDFDATLLKCSFLTRVELKLPDGVLASEGFMLYFPGLLADGLMELILKANKLPAVPPGISDLARIRSIDLSHNEIEDLPEADTWKSISGSLELLDLSFNKLESIEPLAPLSKLSQLKVDANKLTSLDGVSWKDLKQLTTMSAVGNQIAELSDDIGAHAASLEHLELSENKIVALPPNLSELKKLKLVNIAGNPIKDQKAIKAAEKGAKDLKTYLAKMMKGGKK